MGPLDAPLLFGGQRAITDLRFADLSFAAGGSTYGALTDVPGFTFARASEAYSRSSTAMALVASDVPRITDLGFQHEGQATNLVLNTIFTPGWNNTGSITLAQSDPAGGVLASAIIDNSATLYRSIISASITVAADTTQYFAAAWVRRVDSEPSYLSASIRFGTEGHTANAAVGVRGSDNNVTTLNSPDTSDVSSLALSGADWYRLSLARTNGGAETAISIRLAPTTDAALTSGGQTGARDFVWPSISTRPIGSPINVAGSAATRLADSLEFTGWGGLGSSARVDFNVSILNADVQTVAAWLDTNADDQVRPYIDATNKLLVEVVVGGVQQAQVDLGTIAALTDYSLTIAFKGASLIASLNGGAPVSDACAAWPTITRRRIGSGHLVADPFWGFVKRFREDA